MQEVLTIALSFIVLFSFSQEVEKVNGIDKSNISKIGGVDVGDISKVMGVDFSDACDEETSILYVGQTYSIVAIGPQCWMAENLNVGSRIDGVNDQTNNSTLEKYCYDDLESNCDIYGGLYQWNEMMQYTTTPGVQGICPPGWHLPTDGEWKVLEGTVDTQYPVGDPEWNSIALRGFDAGYHLKSETGWVGDGNGNDTYGFAALPGGKWWYSGYFQGLGESAGFWTSSQWSGSSTWFRYLSFLSDASGRSTRYKTDGFSVRCLQDY